MKNILLTSLCLCIAFTSFAQSFVQNQISNCSYLGDINGDGIDDIITINDKQLTVSKVDANSTPILTHTFGATVKRIIIGDFVNSGRERGKKQIAAILSDGTTQAFAISDDKRSLWWWFTQGSFIGDGELFTVANFDSDVAEEILVHNPTTGQIRFFKYGANGSINQMTNFEIGNLGGTSPAGTSLANVQILVGAFSTDHPGRKDLLIVDQVSRQIRLYHSVILSNGNLTFWWAFSTNGNLFPANSQICIANIDGGTQDGMVVRNGTNNTYSLHKVEFGNGNLLPETGANIGQLPTRTGNCRIVAAKVRDAAFRTERGGAKRDDILVFEVANNQLTRTDARFDGTNLTFWWAFSAPLNCGSTTNNWDFETGDLRGWTATGVFSNQPTFEENFTVQELRNSLPILTTALRTIDNVGGDYWRDAIYPIGIQGKYWVGSGENRRTLNNPVGGKQTGVGTLVSKKITLQKKFISFLMGKSSSDTLNLKVEILVRDQNGSILIENERYRILLNGGGGWLDFREIERLNRTLPVGQRIRVPTGGRIYVKGPSEIVINPYLSRVVYDVSQFIGQEVRIRVVDNDVNGFINVDDFQFVDVQVNENRQAPLWGMVDMHTHPMSHLGFGRKIMHGQPDYPSDQTNIAAALGSCNASHGGWGIDNTGGNYIRMSILKIMDEHNPHNNGSILEPDHNHNGFPLYPNHASIAHQQMWHEWIERAHRGGLRVIVALAVNNYLLAEAVDGDAGYKKDKESADRQLEFMVQFVSRHPFMQIARSAREMRSIVSQGELAVILGIEVDNFGDFNDPTKIVNESTVRTEIQRLFNEKGVRYIFPIHFADTKFGGCAIYGKSNLTNLASHFTRSFVSIAASPPEVIANIPGLKYTVERAPDSRIKHRLTNPLEIDIPTVANASIAGLRGFIEQIEIQPNPCAGAFLDPIRGPICATAGINLACPNLQCVLAQESEYRIVKNFMLTPSPEYEAYALTPGGHRNAKGITNLGIFAIKEMMRLGMMIDMDHMSEKMIDSVLSIAKLNGYPINSGHTGFRGNGGDSENTRTDEQLAIIRSTGGMMGVGIASNISPSFLHNYRYGISRLNGITIGSDINGMEVMPKPRFSANGQLIQSESQNYTPYPQDIRDRANNKVRYTNTTEGANIPLTMSRTAGKSWNYNFDGMAHVGLYPDYLQDLKNLGMTNVERGRLFIGAEYFAQMWEKCERQKTNVR